MNEDRWLSSVPDRLQRSLIRVGNSMLFWRLLHGLPRIFDLRNSCASSFSSMSLPFDAQHPSAYSQIRFDLDPDQSK